MRPVSITVITATKNCEKILPGLIRSLEEQSDQDFEWVVIDGDSNDDTVAVARAAKLNNIRVLSGADFSIYDALNRGVRAASGDYYLVLGADDTLHSHAVEKYREQASDSDADVVVASVEGFNRILKPLSGRQWLRGGNSIAASHAVGTLFKKSLHQQHGFYSNKYVNCADMFFILKAKNEGAKIIAGDFVAGSFGSEGISSTDRIGSLSDAFRIQLVFQKNWTLQFAIYFFRVFKYLVK